MCHLPALLNVERAPGGIIGMAGTWIHLPFLQKVPDTGFSYRTYRKSCLCVPPKPPVHTLPHKVPSYSMFSERIMFDQGGTLGLVYSRVVGELSCDSLKFCDVRVSLNKDRPFDRGLPKKVPLILGNSHVGLRG